MLRLCRIAFVFLLAALAGCSNRYNRILEEVYDKDQEVRKWTVLSSLSYDEIVTYSTEMALTDSLNQATVFGILDKEGWPARLSDKANQAIWLVIDHSDLATRRKYLDLVKAKAEEGVLDKSDYATLNDRVLMEEGKPQIYGTQIKITGTIIFGEEQTLPMYLWPVEEPAALDSLRSSIGLPPIEEYLESSGLFGLPVVWDPSRTVADFL
ncbi:MAG: hypothetical protein J6Y63_05870 [Bacteroidales bacterium]|nr:hypothetical protein [Bacteroidales bacterium]